MYLCSRKDFSGMLGFYYLLDMKYKVEIEEILRRTVEIEAASEVDAEMQVRQLYRDCKIVLDADDFIGEPTIKCISK